MSFAKLPKERIREIATMGGKAAHAAGTAHKWTAGEEASAAGKKGAAARISRQRGVKQETQSEKE
jgi:hypothetical protein